MQLSCAPQSAFKTPASRDDICNASSNSLIHPLDCTSALPLGTMFRSILSIATALIFASLPHKACSVPIPGRQCMLTFCPANFADFSPRYALIPDTIEYEYKTNAQRLKNGVFLKPPMRRTRPTGMSVFRIHLDASAEACKSPVWLPDRRPPLSHHLQFPQLPLLRSSRTAER